MKIETKIVGIAFMTAILILSCHQQSNVATQPNPKEIDVIDEKIRDLRQQINQYRRTAFQNEMESQSEMLGDWKGFSEKIKENENEEEKISHLEKEIQTLEGHKKVLMEQKKSLKN